MLSNAKGTGKRALCISNLVALRFYCVAATVSEVTVLLCKVTHAEVQFCVRLSQQIRSHSAAVLQCCPEVFCQLDEPDKCIQPTDHHSSSGVAEFRHEYWTSTEPHCLWFVVFSERLRSMWRWSCSLDQFFVLYSVIYNKDTILSEYFMTLDVMKADYCDYMKLFCFVFFSQHSLTVTGFFYFILILLLIFGDLLFVNCDTLQN